jgi:hypothetical protein
VVVNVKVGSAVSVGRSVGVFVGNVIGVNVGFSVGTESGLDVQVGVMAREGELIRLNPPQLISERVTADMQTKILLLIVSRKGSRKSGALQARALNLQGVI